MAQYRYHNYLAEVRSKKAVEPVALGTGIGPCFGFNVISYDGTTLFISADPDKNYRYNLANDRMVLSGLRSGCITPDGILSTETGVISIPLTLGSFQGHKELFIIANHIYDKTEGGTNVTYRAFINPDSKGDWGTKLKDEKANMETWLTLIKDNLKRNQEVILAYCKIEKVGEDHKVSDVKNPYHYVWGVSNYVTMDRYLTDLENLRNLIPQFESVKVQLTNKEAHVTLRGFLNDPDGTTDDKSILTLLEPELLVNKLGDALDFFFGGTLDCSAGGIDLAKQIAITLTAEMDFSLPIPIEAKWQSPMAFNWLSAATEDPASGKRLCQNTHACYGTISLDGINFTLNMQLFPIKGNQGSVAANLLPQMEFTQRIAMMAQLSEMFEVILDVTSQEGTTGSGDVSGAGKYRRGTVVYITASPSDGSGFVGWYEGNTLISVEQSYSFEIARSVNYIAMFNGSSTKVEIKVTVQPEGKGTVKGAGMYAINTKCTLECTPSSGYGFKQWEMGGKVYDINPLTFGVSKGENVLCVLTPPKRNLQLFSNPSGVMTLLGAGSYEVGKDVTARATVVNNEYQFKGWYKNSVASANFMSSNPNYSFKMPDANLSLMAFAELKPKQKYLVTAYTSGYGYVSGAGWYEEGETVSLRATATDGASFSSWSGDYNTSMNPLTFTVTRSITVTANFSGGGSEPEPDQVYIYANASPSSGGSVSGGGWYDRGSTVYLTATPNSGYSFSHWTGAAVPDIPSISFEAYSDATLTANFKSSTPGKHTLTTNSSPAGSGSVTGGGTYDYGATATIKATPASGKEFVNWSGDVTGTSNPITTVMNMDKFVVANFSGGGGGTGTVHVNSSTGKCQVALIYNGQSTGWSNPPLSREYPMGASVTINSNRAEDGYEAEGIYKDGVKLTDSGSLNVVVDGYMTYDVKYAKKEVTASVSSGRNGSVSSPAGTIAGGSSKTFTFSYGGGSNLSVTANPDSGFKFYEWKVSHGSSYVQYDNPTLYMIEDLYGPDSFVSMEAVFVESAQSNVFVDIIVQNPGTGKFTVVINGSTKASNVESFNQRVLPGDNIYISAAPASGYRLGSIYADMHEQGVFQSDSSPYQLPAVSAECSGVMVNISFHE